MADNARLAAFRILTALEKRDVKLDTLVSEDVFSNPALDERDRAFAKELAYGVTRWKRALDAFIRGASSTPFEKIDLAVLTFLRLGVYQSIFLTRTPISAAVNETVKAAKKDKKAKHLTGFINAVLRNIAKQVNRETKTPDQMVELLLEENKGGVIETIGLRHSYPNWMIKRWIEAYGEERAEQIAKRGNERAPVFVRRNRLVGSSVDFTDALSKDNVSVEKSNLSAECFKVTSGKIRPDSFAVTNGFVQPQDASSQMMAELLNPAPGDVVADLCCGQGIKSGAFVSMMNNSGALFSFDNLERKIKNLQKNMERLGATIVTPVVADLADPLPVKVAFDKIALDAPCTATGVIRRHPDIKWNRDEKAKDKMAETQRRMLESAFDALAPGGRLVYSVCSIEPEEGCALINSFLDGNQKASRENVAYGRVGLLPFASKDGDLLILPGDGGMDGFFASIILKAK